MSRLLLIGTMLIGAIASPASAQEKKRDAAAPVQKLNQPFWKGMHEQFLKRAEKGNVDVVFLGDSITQAWSGAGKKAWTEHFEPLKAANFGIGGDQTGHVLWRITEGKELNGIKPKVAVLMIGTNNISSFKPDQIAEGVTAIVKELRQQKPEMKILLLGVFPRSGKRIAPEAKEAKAGELQPAVGKINSMISKLDDGKMVVYRDIGKRFLNSDGDLPKDIMYDYLHLTPKGYDIWADAIKDEVKTLLGK